MNAAAVVLDFQSGQLIAFFQVCRSVVGMSYLEKSMRSVLFLCLTVAAAAQTLPDGPGKAVVERMCTPCHSLDSVVRARMTKDRWSNMVDEMVSRGAVGQHEQGTRPGPCRGNQPHET